ncbi:DUF421 domain-containing protein [Caulobacter sp. 17J80-11]|uniref:DUF421 domain-containing protein n=1 Tax=Caulobacter sp. 17J80-11 TaxID=2763502 RepID=UPI0016534FB3|nr:YetF domain-containing protein [Caulobacter sp. 17J80-11]MBC6980136.1 DUF421 domain-containing protein [Caulobacter sp. 17J80-11]
MDSVLRAAAVYFVLMLLFRVAGRRALGQITTFDFVLLLIISEATQNAMIGDDFSVTNGVLVISTLIFLNIALSLLKDRSRFVEKLVDGVPTVLVADGRLLEREMRKARVGVEDILHAAREKQGLERLDQIKYAVLEVSGGINVIPKDQK